MTKITKVMLAKHKETLSPWIQEFVQTAATTPLELLPQYLATFPSRWPFPRGDLYHWIPLLNRFDSVLEAFCSLYGLHDAPQTKSFTCELLNRDLQSSQNLSDLDFGEDGDRQLVESILDFSRLLLENCGNRSIYGSSPYLSDLLNSTSLSLIIASLQIGTQLAQRYQASYKRMSSPHRHANTALLLNHYNIDLDKVQSLAQPFVRTVSSAESPSLHHTTTTPTPKSKEKALFSGSSTTLRSSVSTYYANDLVALVKNGDTANGASKGKASASSPQQNNWNDWGDIRLTYYAPQSQSDHEADLGNSSTSVSGAAPGTPTPVRRSSGLSQQHGQRSSRLSTSEDSSTTTSRQVSFPDEAQSSTSRVLEIPSSRLKSTSIHQVLEETVPTIPATSKYELLTKLRVADALTGTMETRRQILAVRILAITNLAYIHSEQAFLEKVLKQDGDEPRRLQLVYQLAELIHPPAEEQSGVPRSLQTIALSGLEALAQHQTKYQDISTALNTNVNHGVLLYIVRKAVAEMAIEESGDMSTEKDAWRTALFSLLSHVATLPRAGSELVTAGLVPILVEILTLRTSIAEQNYPKVLNFLDAVIFNVRDAFQILVNANGLDAISDLIIHEVKTASEHALANEGFRPEFRSASIDYQIPYFQQQSIKWLFKFIHHIMTTAGGYGGNFDRLLRNLIDSSQLLAGLRQILGHAQIFGSTVWTNAVTILNDFINNEPTSFAVIAEAGLSREFLEAVIGQPIKMPDESRDSQTQSESQNGGESPLHTDNDSVLSMVVDDAPHPPTKGMLDAPRGEPLARGIMPSAEAINIIPQAFGAICLNTSGMRMFQASNALQSFFEIFESPAHVQCLESDHHLATNLGSTFDELVRHHPPLKNAIINGTLDMVARVVHLCKVKVRHDKSGAKLWSTDLSGNPIVADGFLKSKPEASSPVADGKGKAKAEATETDVDMTGSAKENTSPDQVRLGAETTNNITPYVYTVSTFLSTLFSNSSVRALFMERGGIEFVLDLAELPILSNSFADDRASRTLQTVIAMMAETKPHLVMPSLLKRAQRAADVLIPFAQHDNLSPFFGGFVSKEIVSRLNEPERTEYLSKGTELVEALVRVQALITAIRHCFQTPMYNQRTQVTSFNSMNLADYYVALIKSVGALLGASTREYNKLQNVVPRQWDSSNRDKETFGFLLDSETRYLTLDSRIPNENENSEGLPSPSRTPGVEVSSDRPGSTHSIPLDQNRSQAKNFMVLRQLLAKVQRTVPPFFQVIGKALIPKRSPEPFQRQNFVSIADALADTVLSQLAISEFQSSTDKFRYWSTMLDTVKDVLIYISRPSDRPFEPMTLVLQAFKDRNGFHVLNQMLNSLAEESKIVRNTDTSNTDPLDDELPSIALNKILDLYQQLVTGRTIVEAPQTSALARPERDRTKTDFFSSGQFLVELRMAILPTVRHLWESDLVEKGPKLLPLQLIEIIKIVAVADYEQGAFKRSEKIVPPPKQPRKLWKANSDHLVKLIEAGFKEDLAKEALFRCNNSYSLSLEYCKAQNSEYSGGRNPVPQNEIDVSADPNGSARITTRPSTGTATPDIHSMQVDEVVSEESSHASSNAMAPPPVPNQLALNQLMSDPMAMSFDNILDGISRNIEDEASSRNQDQGTSPAPSRQVSSGSVSTQSQVITIDDLDDERAAIRGRLIERCLDIINTHGEFTFEIADLIGTVVDKSPDSIGMRREVGETLVNALMSFIPDLETPAVGKKVSAYAHLLGIMLGDRSFYNASIGELKLNIDVLLEFVKLSPQHSSEESSQWIAQILLVLETPLREDSQPQETDWKIPISENSSVESPVLREADPVITSSQRATLFGSLLDILPRIGKDETLALSALRILDILTRTRELALAMGERKNIQRLFVMAKQLAGASSARVQDYIMLILRHIIEDEETIMQIMRAEIKAYFEAPRPQRHIDVATYLRQLSHVVIRAPDLFVKVSGEMVKLSRWSSNVHDSPGRQQLELQDEYRQSTRSKADDVVLPTLQATEELTLQDVEDVKPTTEGADRDVSDHTKAPGSEHKTPTIETTDGVVHFLLSELLNYKDVEDKDPIPTSADKAAQDSTAESSDTPMLDLSSPPDTSSQPDIKDLKKSSKQEFKPEEHPIYIYRCFLLQCLAELLSSYNRTKSEFINFKRNANPQVMTPSKPRSTVVNYLLTDLLPIGTLDHSESISHRKKQAVSSRTDGVLSGLLLKTGEQIFDRNQDPTDLDEEPELLRIRKFVLDHILKAYKEASTSSEALDIKYSRMLSLADLMNHLMSDRDSHGNGGDLSVVQRSSSQLKRLMFEKGFITALTASIADIDLNFPGAKRAIKHILRPLKVLTQTAIELSDAGKITSASGQVDEDEIATASSISEIDDEREETPDLFRNSTLGMFEPGRDHESSSDSEDDDEEMYEGEYDEELDYEEEMVDDDEDNISDDDEDIEAMGEIEGLPGEHGVDVEVIMEDDDGDEDEGPSDEEDGEDDEEDEDLEDMEDDEDDERVEIVDEHGNPLSLGEGDDEDEWQSDEDEEEEDYEGRAADEEEEEEHRLDDLANGPLGHLVRALGGEAHEGGLGGVLQRIEHGNIDADEQMELEGYLEDGQDDEEDEEDEEDMEEDEGLYDDYHGGSPGMALEWYGEAADAPTAIITSQNPHRPRHDIPSPFPWGRDPLPGMFALFEMLASFRSQAAALQAGPLSRRFNLPQSISARDEWESEFDEILSEIDRLSTTLSANPPSVNDYRGTYRSHRPGSAPRGNDDGTNPLLQRASFRDSGPPGSSNGPLNPARENFMEFGFGRIGRRGPSGVTPGSLLNDMITSLPLPIGAIARHGHALHFHVTGGPGRGDVGRDLQAMFGMGRGLNRIDNRRETSSEPGNATFFNIQSTSSRWTEEAKILFLNTHTEKALKVLLGLMAVLVPPAMKAEVKAIQERKAAEEKRKREEEERIAKEKKEAEERAAQERKEAQEREAAERQRAAEAAARVQEGVVEHEDEDEAENINPEAMEGIEASSVDVAPGSSEEVPVEERPRVTTVIRGTRIDITDLGIDADFLQELPEDIREEVITSAVAERRSQAAASGAQPSEIDQEFLDALPDEIRDEIIQQERQDRRRREREEQRRQAAANGGPAAVVVQDMDAASILATLPADLRAQVLAEQDEDVLAQLPPEYVAQARAAMRDHPLSHIRSIGGIGRPRPIPTENEQALQKPQRRSIVQMLDKSGIATLLRLMFIFQQDSLRNTLFQVLQNISENRHNRAEVISTLLHILQDGSVDMGAVERSFTHLSLRAKQPKDKEPKTPQLLKRTSTTSSLNIVANSEISPLMVVQQCLGTLIYLCKVNLHVPSFFLTEHESASGLKRSTSRKGKGKESRASKYPLNSLLSLLDRKLIMESSSVMESLSDVLSRITAPLQNLERKQKEASETTDTDDTNQPTSADANIDAPPAADNTTQVEATEVLAEGNTEDIEPPTEPGNQPATGVAKESEQKKQRPIIPPVVPDSNLKLVINIFVARECSARTFRETLSTIKNLSCIPGAKAVFGKELICKAQDLAEVILVDLDELLPQIQNASTGTDIQGVALAKFSPSGSDQNKLLRVLTALDHLFEPKNSKTETDGTNSQNADSSSGQPSKETEKQDLLATLYENSTFGPMWEKLSACLSAIRQREHMLSVATILLPLIESLMVVCKNTTLKDTISRSQVGKDLMLTSPPPESRMESLFFSFTEEHRKILNELVRHSPKLMSGTFSLLVKNPKVLEFDNKRNYFNRSIHNRNTPSRQSFPPLQLSVRRDQVFHDSFKSLYFKNGDEMKFGKLSIRFHGEEGVDAGGVTREWFQVLSRQMFDPGYALFIPVSSDRTTFHPNHMSSINPEHLMFFKFIGRIIGKALYEGRVLDCHFSRAVYKRILGKSVSIKDLESLDPEYYKSVIWMLENDITDIITETFSVDNDKFGVVETVDLIENGRNIPVTQENKHEYVRLMVEFKLTGSVQEQLDNFLKGFHEIIPAELVSIFNEQELELLISGLPEIDVDDWKSNTEYHNYTGASPQIQWFWRAVRSFDKEEQAKLLQFVTGTSKVPLNGFKELEGMNGFSRFNIHRDYGNKDRLPSSHTCFNQLDLPEYESYEVLRHQILTAITAGSEYFGFA